MLNGRGITLLLAFVLSHGIVFWGFGIGDKLFENNLAGLLLGMVLGLIIGGFATQNADKIILRAANAQPLTRSSHEELFKVTRLFAQKFKMPMPKLYSIPEGLPNFFVYGSSMDRCTIVYTTGFLELSRPELITASVSWAMHSAANGGLQIRTLASALAYIFMFPAKLGDFLSLGSSTRYNLLNLILLFPLALFACIFVQLGNEKRDIYETDKKSCDLIGDQAYLAVALIEIDKNIVTFKVDVDICLVPLFVAPPRTTNFYYKWFRPFPPLAKRIHRLKRQRDQSKKSATV